MVWAIPWLLALHSWGIGPTLNAIIFLIIYFTHQSFQSICIIPRPHTQYSKIMFRQFVICTLEKNYGYSRYIFQTCIKCSFFSDIAYIQHISEIIISFWVRSGYNVTTVKKLMSEIYIMALRVGPKSKKCNVSNHGIALMYSFNPNNPKPIQTHPNPSKPIQLQWLVVLYFDGLGTV